MRILIEASGSLTSNYLINAIKEAGCEVVGSDISTFNHAFALCDDFIIMPKVNDIELWQKTKALLIEHRVDAVIPSFDETLIGWASRVDEYAQIGISIIVSPLSTIEIFQDKWSTYQFFTANDIPTPKTSLVAEFDLIKPRLGRGGSGIFDNTNDNTFSMQGMISQQKIGGTEYTVDVFYTNESKPLYIIPRTRIDVKEGKSTKGVVVAHAKISQFIVDISQQIQFIGPINFQLFETPTGELIFIEINPRIAGGMALGFAASENWVGLIVDNIINNKPITAKEIKHGLKMVRYYSEAFIQ